MAPCIFTPPKQEGLDRALELVTRMFKTIEIGELYTGKIVSTTTFGAFMEVLPGKDGLIHISELAEGRTAKTEDVVSVGDVVTAKCIGIDDKGRVKMSIRAALLRCQGCRSRSRRHYGITFFVEPLNSQPRFRLFRERGFSIAGKMFCSWFNCLRDQTEFFLPVPEGESLECWKGTGGMELFPHGRFFCFPFLTGFFRFL